MNQPPHSYGSYTPDPMAPPPRQGRPWWVWLLGGCGGCALIVIIAGVVLFAMGANYIKGITQSVGEITPARIQKDLGADVPIYPGATLDPTVTKVTLISVRTIEKVANKPAGAIFRGLGAFRTSDSPEKVFKFYDQKLKAAGWKPQEVREQSASEQRAYRKANDFVMIQAQQEGSTGGQVIILMRGGPEMMKQKVRTGGSGGSAQ